MSEDLVLSDARSTTVGELGVRRALPTRGRRTVGAWCFIDHMGPATFSPDHRYDVAPHPHIGLQTVTWLFDGAIMHRDSMGSEQLIRPGQVNLMTSGQGVTHSEENPGLTSGELHGVQLWVALPSSSRNDAPAFEHLGETPAFDLANGHGTVLVGKVENATSSARHHSDLVGMELQLQRGASVLALERRYEYAVVVTVGALEVDGVVVTPGHLAYLGHDRDDVRLTTSEHCVAMVLGGVPFDETIVMWWNFVARTHDEISLAYESWVKSDDRFGRVASTLPRIEIGPPPWFHAKR